VAGDNLPAQLTTLIGREHEVGELKEMLVQSRLVTLTGAPGCGKTRLAIAVAADAHGLFPDGILFVELGPLADSALLVQTIARAFGVREGSDRPPMTALIEQLRNQQPLLIMDNCEHLLDACAEFLETALTSCPSLRVLATSRELLEVNGELAYRVPSLSHSAQEDDDVHEYDAPRLFIDRARLRLPTFHPTRDDLKAIGAICRHLDGIPLAIELAAAKIDVLSPARILDYLSDRFRLLTGGRRRRGGRQQTLRAAVDWSYALLSATEQQVFRRLAVFGGSFSLAAAEAVATTNDVRSEDVLELVAQLLKKSLIVVQQGDGELRYRLLETLSEYGREKLLEHDELSEARNRHLRFFSGIAEAAFSKWRTAAHSSLLQRLSLELENLRLALDWAREQDREAWVRLSGALAWFWLSSDRLTEGRSRVEESLRVRDGTDADRARTLGGACAIAYNQADFAAVTTFAAEQAQVCRQLGDRAGLASALTSLGAAALFKDHDLEAAESYVSRSFELSSAGGFASQASEALTIRGLIGFWRDDMDSVQEPWEHSLQLCEQAGDVPQRIRMLVDMTCLNLIRGDVAQARLSAAAARAAYQAAPGHHGLEEMFLECYAWLAIEGGDDERGLQLAGAARSLSKLSGALEAPTWGRYWTVVLRRATAALPADVAERALNEGSRLGLDAAFTLALAPGGSVADRRYVEVAGIRLTRRERDVAVMVARGMSNRQIASQLVLAERTVEGHVENLRNKLGFHSRARIAAWVAANGLPTEVPG
jgi:predicted ATPase/DNA-binding CsgD family transcriptional regulator